MMNWWDHIVFAQRWALWLLLLVPLFILLLYFLAGRGRPVLALSSFRYMNGVGVPARVKWRIVLHFLRIAALVLLIIAFARPQTLSNFIPDKGNGIDIVLCIDVSPSMVSEGFDPQKLQAAKDEAVRFVNERPNDRIGVVEFSGETFTLSPLTADHEALNTIISNIEVGPLDMGTAIGMGLAKSVERIRDSKAKSKVIVLLTDGENNAGTIQPVDAGRLAKTYGVRVYTIGLGQIEGKELTPVLRNPDGSIVQQYQDVSIDEQELMQIATMTGGKYFRATDGKKLELIYREINLLEKSEFNAKGHWQRREEAWIFFLIALGLLLVEFTLRYTVFDSLT